MPTKAKSKEPVFIEDDDNIDVDDDNDTSRGNTNRPSVMDLRPSDIDYTPMTEEEMKTADDSELKLRAGALPKIYDMVPESVWSALTTGKKGLKDADHRDNLREIWRDNIDQFQQCHAESLNIVKRIYPNLCAVTGVVKNLGYAVMKTRFSQDGPAGTGAGVDKTFVERMYGILVNNLTGAQKHYLVADGDLLVVDANTIDPDDSDTEVKADATQSSKTDTTTTGRKKRKRVTSIGRNKQSHTAVVDDTQSNLRPESSDLVERVYDIVNRACENTEEAKTRIEDLLNAQSEITEAIMTHNDRLHDDAERSRTSVEGLRDFYATSGADRQALVNSYTRVIDILYNSYLETFTLLHSANIWFGTPVQGNWEDYEQRLNSIAGRLHPRPLQPLRGSTSLEFKDTADIVRDITIPSPLDLKTELKRETCVRDTVVSVLRFSGGLQAELDSMGKIPPNGMIDIRSLQHVPYNTAKRIMAEFDNLRPAGRQLIQVNDLSTLEAMGNDYKEYQRLFNDNREAASSTAGSSTGSSTDDSTVGSSERIPNGGSCSSSQTDGSSSEVDDDGDGGDSQNDE